MRRSATLTATRIFMLPFENIKFVTRLWLSSGKETEILRNMQFITPLIS